MGQLIQITINLSIFDVAVFTEVLPVIFYLFFRKRINDKNVRVIFFLLLYLLINDVIGWRMFQQKKSNFLFYNVSILVETITIFYFLSTNLTSNFFRKLFVPVSIVYFILWGRQMIVGKPIGYANYLVIIQAIIVLVISLYYFYEQLSNITQHFIYYQPAFWIISGFFIYYSGTFFLYLYMETLSLDDQKNYYFLNDVCTIMRTLLLSVGMFMHAEKTSLKKVNY